MSERPASIGSFSGRVGHKAGGFISKKFFHPSNFKNQEKLWSAIEEKKEREKRQDELMKKRDEERRVELLKLEMFKGTGGASSSSSHVAAPSGGGLFASLSASNAQQEDGRLPQERNAANETKRRIELLNSTSTSSTRINVNSRYEEDVHEDGHSAVWGSYFDIESKTWGYGCCKTMLRHEKCPLSTSSPKRKRH